MDIDRSKAVADAVKHAWRLRATHAPMRFEYWPPDARAAVTLVLELAQVNEHAASLASVVRELLSYVECEYGLEDTPTADLETGSGVELTISRARRLLSTNEVSTNAPPQA